MFSLEVPAKLSSAKRPVIVASLTLFLSTATYAQSSPRPGASPPEPPPGNSEKSEKADSSRGDFGSPESEMRSKLLLKEAKKQYDENVARAREASELGSQLEESFETKKTLGSEDTKKLERLEKLTRKIRGEAGGSDGEEEETKDIPSEIGAAVKRLAQVAGDLYKLVEKTPRHVVSATVINQANKLIGLAQRLRNSNR